MNENSDPLKQKLTAPQIAFLVLSIFMIVSLMLAAVHTFNMARQKAAKPGPTPTQQITSLQRANKALNDQNSVLTAKNGQLMDQQSKFCADLSKAKIVEPLCTQ